MKKLLSISATVAVLLAASGAVADTLFSTPVLVVSPQILKFGAVNPHHEMTNTVVVQNFGSGKLAGKASVKPPFKILNGASYILRQNEAQVMTIVYIPKASDTITNTMKFTGGGGATVTLIARPTNPIRP